MAAPTYGHDLTTFNDCTNAANWAEALGMTQGGGPDTDTDLAILGTTCITQDRLSSANLYSQVATETGPTLPTDGVFLIWHKMFGPNSLATEAAGGVRMLVGSDISNYYGWYIDGSDTYTYGGWVNYAIDPTIGSPDQTQGTPTGVYNTVGQGWSLVNGISKGNPVNTDIIRWGRGTSYFANGDLANGYATFTGFAAINDNATTGRLGLIQSLGASYLFKGKMSFGSGTTAVDFRDSNTQIIIDNTKKVSSTFNRIEVNVATSRVDLTSIEFVSLCSISKGDFEMIDNATVNMISCSFTDLGTFFFQSGATMIDTSFVGTEYLVQSGSTFDGCFFTEITGLTQVYVDDLSLITNSEFTSPGTGHGIELDSNHAGNSYNLDNITWIGYATVSGTTGNEAIYNNSGGHVQLSVINDSDTPSIRNGAGSTTEFVSSVILSMTVTDTNGLPISGASSYIDDDNESPFIMNQLTDASGLTEVIWTGGEVASATWRIRKYGYKPYKATTIVPATGEKNIPVTLIVDLQQT